LIRCEIRFKLYTIVKREVKVFTPFMCRSYKSARRFFRSLKLFVVGHTIAAIQKNAQSHRLFFAREEHDRLRNTIIEHRKILNIQSEDVATEPIGYAHTCGHERNLHTKRLLRAQQKQRDDDSVHYRTEHAG